MILCDSNFLNIHLFGGQGNNRSIEVVRLSASIFSHSTNFFENLYMII